MYQYHSVKVLIYNPSINLFTLQAVGNLIFHFITEWSTSGQSLIYNYVYFYVSRK